MEQLVKHFLKFIKYFRTALNHYTCACFEDEEQNSMIASFRKMHSTESTQSQSRSVEVVDTHIIQKRSGYSSNNKTGNSNINGDNNGNNSKKALQQQQIFSFCQQQETQSHLGHQQIQSSGDSYNSHNSRSFEDSATKITKCHQLYYKMMQVMVVI